MNRPTRCVFLFGWLALCIVHLFVAESSAGQIIGVSQDPPLPMTFVGDDSNDDMIVVGTPSNPIVVVPDGSTTNPWMKIFTVNRDHQGWSETGPGSMVNVMEFITFPPTSTLPVVDWHEDIDPTFGDGAKFKWAGGTIMTSGGVFPGMVSPDGKSIWFDFPPTPPGTPIKITKNLMWIGPPAVVTPGPVGTNNYTIKINERPSVPEPSGIVLSLFAIVASASLRRAR